MARNLNRVLAVGLAATMIMGSAVTAFAADPAAASGTAVDITGTGTEVNAVTDVYSVVAPTSDALSKTFKYVVDPEGLVAASKAAFGSDVTVNDNNGVLFKNTDGSSVSVSGTSDKITFINKSYKPVDIEVTFKLAGTFDYAGNISTTEDFSGTNDATKGLYFGLIATSEAEKAFSVIGTGTATSFVSVVQSDKDEYELKGTNSSDSTTYAYTLKTDAKGQEYNLQVKAALNPAVAMTTWQTTANDGTVTAKTMPEITMTFKPTQNKDVIAQAKWNSGWGFDIALATGSAADGKLGETKPTAITWNGKTVDVTKVTMNNGWCTIPWSEIIAAYNTTGTTFTTSKYDDAIWKGGNVIKFTWNGNNYIADVK